LVTGLRLANNSGGKMVFDFANHGTAGAKSRLQTGAPGIAGAKSRLRALLLIPFLLLATGCARLEEPADLVIINGAEPESLDPAIITGQPDGRVVGALFDGLTRFNPKTATPEPALAERWDISGDGRVYTFHLRPNLVWSTGEPITAADVVYSWRRALDPATASDYAGQLFFLKNAEDFNAGKIKDPGEVGVQALGPRTVRAELVGPTPFFLDLCAFRTLAVVPRQAIEKHGDRWLMERPLPVSGAYQLEFWRIHDRIRVRKNPLYWDAANTQNELVDFLPVEAATTALNLYETGIADIIWDKGLIPPELLDLLTQRPDCHRFAYLGTYFFRFNLTRPPFNDLRVRQALALAIDKQRIVEKITRGGEKTAAHFTPPGLPNYEPPAGLGYDPARARQLLAEAGFPNGAGFPSFEYLFNSNKLHEQIAVELQQMWRKELGVRMELRQTEWKVYLAALTALEFDVCRSGWIGDYVDPNTFLDMFMSNNGNNRTGWKNERYDQLVRDANQLTDVSRRMKLLQEAERLLVLEELPIVPLYFYAGINLFDPARIEGIYQNLLDEHPINSIRKKVTY
jgi:oligopeptide transport system substrate-binding protein